MYRRHENGDIRIPLDDAYEFTRVIGVTVEQNDGTDLSEADHILEQRVCFLSYRTGCHRC